ncbi:CBN-SRBC-41 protein [Caenorhabditis brenneri]|uniref:CBN-SRBC-41 protein n=1 Tax=Caenorhabditis brenneri TaxID=135651 RepID=G0PHT2_CAEBE|nr:CBN-SRBC-41 protein [Caenorhabditis brenneri]
MNPSAFVVTLIGSIASFFVILGNLFLLYSTRKKKHELVLFYFRFFIDVVFGLAYFPYSFFILGFTIYESSFFIPNYYLFWLGLPFSNASAARNFLILIIVLDRLLATYLPILYHNIRPRVSNLILFVLPVIFIGVEDFVIFIICGKYSESIEPTCVSFPCTLNTCGYYWWTSYKSVIFPIIIILTVVLCFKLFLFSKKLQDSSATKRANRLALLDAFLIFIFDCIPSFLAYQFPDSPLIEYTSAGPVTAMLKQVGRAIESFIVIDILVRRMRVDGTRRKSSQVVIIGAKNSK